MQQAVKWIWQRLSRWDVAAFGAPILFGAGIAAMYGDEYIVAGCLYLLATVWLTAKALVWEETTGHEQRKGISLLIVLLAVFVYGGSVSWIFHRYEHIRELSGRPSTGFVNAAVIHAWRWIRSVNGPWLRPAIYFVAGTAFAILAMLLPRIRRVISFRRARNIALAGAKKGFLDYKLQAEESMKRLTNIFMKITRIIEQVGPSMEGHTNRLKTAARSSTRVHVKMVGRAARSLDYYSRKLDARCAELERVADSTTEGLSGWLAWVNKQKNRDAATQMMGALRLLENQITATIANFDRYLVAVESGRGASREMNIAVDAHLRSFGRVRAAAERIRKSCSDNLQLIESHST